MIRHFIRGWRVYPRANKWSIDNFGVGLGSRYKYAIACAKAFKIRRTYLEKVDSKTARKILFDADKS